MVTRKKHAKRAIEEAIQYAEQCGWTYKATGASAHAWGRLLCPLKKREGCSMSVWSTPRNAEIHAKQIRARVNSCPHDQEVRK